MILYFNCITLVKHIKSVGRIRLKINKSQKIICQIFLATGHLWLVVNNLKIRSDLQSQTIEYQWRQRFLVSTLDHQVQSHDQRSKWPITTMQGSTPWLQKAELFFLFQSVHITGRRPQRTSGPKTNCTTKAYSRDTNDLNLQIKRRCVSLNMRIKNEKNESHCVFRLFSWSCWVFFSHNLVTSNLWS